MQADLQTETETVAGLRDLFCVVFFALKLQNLQKIAGLTTFGVLLELL
jgi:hypothetical protein